ncbi:hypothetical protein BH11BAC7_BH11BAC7_20760 [soil metagenome]
MFRNFFLFLLLSVSSTCVVAQTMAPADEAFQKGLAIYMYLSDSANSILLRAPSGQQVQPIMQKADEGLALFDEALNSTYSSTIRRAKYFHANLLNEKALLYSTAGEHKKSYDIFLLAKAEFEILDKENDFPITYPWKEKEYIIRREAFDEKYSNVYVFISNQCYLLRNDVEMLSWGRLARARTFSSTFLPYALEVEMINAKQHLSQFDQELLDFSLSLLVNFSRLNQTDAGFARNENVFGVKVAYDAIVKTLTIHPELDETGSYRVKAAPLLGWADLDKEEEDFYEQAMDKGYGDDAFYSTLSSVADNHKNTRLEQKTCDVWYSKIGDAGDGFYLKVLALHYEQLGNAARSEELKKRAAVCAKRDAKEKRSAKKKG